MAVSVEMMVVHGLKMIGIGVVETVPNPLHLPDGINQGFAITTNLLFPILVTIGLFTRLATLPILTVTLTCYFVLHFQDDPHIRDTPYIYIICSLIILFWEPANIHLMHLLVNEKKLW